MSSWQLIFKGKRRAAIRKASFRERLNAKEEVSHIMPMKEAIKEYSDSIGRNESEFVIATDEDGYWNINVCFTDEEGKEDETQFDILPAQFDYEAGKCKELECLWKEFCLENGYSQDSVTEIYFVRL